VAAAVKRWEKLPFERFEAYYDDEGRELPPTI
jgi:hypothetical protein